MIGTVTKTEYWAKDPGAEEPDGVLVTVDIGPTSPPDVDQEVRVIPTLRGTLGAPRVVDVAAFRWVCEECDVESETCDLEHDAMVLLSMHLQMAPHSWSYARAAAWAGLDLGTTGVWP